MLSYPENSGPRNFSQNIMIHAYKQATINSLPKRSGRSGTVTYDFSVCSFLKRFLRYYGLYTADLVTLPPSKLMCCGKRCFWKDCLHDRK